jgi:uncharacterized coiled-coil protein SlyX
MDKKQIIHIASEVVVISGLAVYFKLKNNSLMKMIEELENKLETQQESINEFQTRFSTQEYELHRHELILSSLVAKARNMKEDNIEEYHYEPIQTKRTKPQVGSRIQPQVVQRVQPQPQGERKKTEKRIETQGERKKTEKRIEPQAERKITHAPIVETVDEESEEENLDEEILNELNELVQGSPARPKIEEKEEEEEIIEIDTSLKKKA